MSYDVYVGGSDKHLNYTSNARKLFNEHISDNGKGGGIHELHGTKNTEVVEILGQFFESVNAERRSNRPYNADMVVGEPELTDKYDSPNGWGSLVGALIFAGEILAEAAKNPDGVTEISA